MSTGLPTPPAGAPAGASVPPVVTSSADKWKTVGGLLAILLFVSVVSFFVGKWYFSTKPSTTSSNKVVGLDDSLEAAKASVGAAYQTGLTEGKVVTPKHEFLRMITADGVKAGHINQVEAAKLEKEAADMEKEANSAKAVVPPAPPTTTPPASTAGAAAATPGPATAAPVFPGKPLIKAVPPVVSPAPVSPAPTDPSSDGQAT